MFPSVKCFVMTSISVLLGVLVCSYGHGQSGYARVGATLQKGVDVVSSENGDEDEAADDDFDLEACQRFCLGSPAGSNRSAGMPLATCLQDCNDRYWKSYDRHMKKLGN